MFYYQISHVNFQFTELFGSGIMDLFCSCLDSFSTKVICQDVFEEVVSKPDAMKCLMAAFLEHLSQRLSGNATPAPSSAISFPHLGAPETMNEQHEGT